MPWWSIFFKERSQQYIDKAKHLQTALVLIDNAFQYLQMPTSTSGLDKTFADLFATNLRDASIELNKAGEPFLASNANKITELKNFNEAKKLYKILRKAIKKLLKRL